MGDWSIEIMGTGAHHNQDFPKDADRLAQRFVDELVDAGHIVRLATFTSGGRTVLDTVDNQAASHRRAGRLADPKVAERVAEASEKSRTAFGLIGLGLSPRREPLAGVEPQGIPEEKSPTVG